MLTIAASSMREINRSAILEMIRRESPLSRSEIAERLQVSLPTVMRIVDELIADGFVRPHGSSTWSGGRRRHLLTFNADGYVVLGVDMGGTKMYGATSDIGGNIIDEIYISEYSESAEENFSILKSIIDQLLASPKLEGRRVRGIGVGAPGVTLHKHGIVKWAYGLHWQDFPLKDRLSAHYSLPITVDNDVNLAALGELWFGAGQNVQNMILITIGTGIGAGIVLDGALYRGSSEASGEIGHMLPNASFLGQNYTQYGALESVASGTGIVQRARNYLQSRMEASELARLTIDDVFEAARRREGWAREILDETVDYLALAIANLTVAFDPQLIILGGSVTRAADLLVEPILSRINGAIPNAPRMTVSSLGLQAVTMGAITHVLHNTSNFYRIQKLS